MIANYVREINYLQSKGISAADRITERVSFTKNMCIILIHYEYILK